MVSHELGGEVSQFDLYSKAQYTQYMISVGRYVTLLCKCFLLNISSKRSRKKQRQGRRKTFFFLWLFIYKKKQNTIHIKNVTVVVSGYMVWDYYSPYFNDEFCQIIGNIQVWFFSKLTPNLSVWTKLKYLGNHNN